MSRKLHCLKTITTFNVTSITSTAQWRTRRIQIIFAVCRAMLCKRGLCHHVVSIRLSVRVSDTFVDHAKTNKCIINIFSPSGSHAILVFPYQTA